jgi:osmoprotectant transport system ATP-binding protein
VAAPAVLPAPATAIEFRGARAEYPNGTVAVEGLDLDVREHEILVLVGPSGCGKSTTLRMVNRLVPLAAGHILVGGQDVAATDPVALRRRIGYVIQNVGLFPHRTVAANVGTVPTLLGWGRDRVRARTAEMLELVGLPAATYARRYPYQLSGGEQQRVGVARALAADPPVLLMDEPFGAVDPIGRRRLQEEFWRIQRAVGTTVIFVTHDVDEAVRLGDRIVVMSKPGHPEQVADAVTLLARPAPGMVTDFVGTGRTARLLPITEVTRADLEPAGPAAPADGALRLGDRLDVALAALVTRDAVDVTDGRVVVGRLTADGVLRALRREVAAAPAEPPEGATDGA